MFAQAIVAIIAILAVVIAVMLQARGQHKAALAALEHQRVATYKSLALAIDAIAREASDSIRFAVKELNSQQNVFDVAGGVRYFRRHAIAIHEQSLHQIPLYQITSSNLIKLVMHMTSISAQAHYTIESALQNRELLSMEAFTSFFNEIDQIAGSADDIARAIHNEVESIKT